MAALGDKIASTILAQSAGVPTLPWSGSGVSMPLQSSGDVTIPDDVYQSACVHSVDEAIATCQAIGYPAMLKVGCVRHSCWAAAQAAVSETSTK